jgi:aerobic-type carbon monoxide dehydrogenase small subunit (CoxS/CutS family)
MAVTTVEGIGSIKNGLHPVQVCNLLYDGGAVVVMIVW